MTSGEERKLVKDNITFVVSLSVTEVACSLCRFSREVEDKDLEYMPRLKNFKNPFVVDETQIGTP